MGVRPNKGMKLTKLVAAPVRQGEVPPRARAARSDAGTASQLIPGVRRLALGRNAVEAHPGVDTALRLMCGRTGSAAQRGG